MISARLLDFMPLLCSPTLGLRENILVSVSSVLTTSLVAKVIVTSA